MDAQRQALIDSIDLHLEAGRHIVPCRPGTKHALERGYQDKRYSKSELIWHVENGVTALGWVLGPRDLVIDVDPRKAGALESMRRLMLRLAPGGGLDLTTLTVATGGADLGRHFYMTLPRDCKDLKTEINDYIDIEFKNYRQTVVVPPSKHPDTGRLYRWHPIDAAFAAPPMVVPDWLIQSLTPTRKGPGESIEYDPISRNQLAGLLASIPATDFADNNTWIRVAMAAHHATRGAGLDVFLDWCMSDPAYHGHETIITTRWDSFSEYTEDGITLATLNQIVAYYGGEPIPLVRNLAKALDELPPNKNVSQTLTNDRVITIAESLCQIADEMDPNTKGADIEDLLRKSLDAGPSVYSRVRKSLKHALGISVSDLDEYVRRLKRQIKTEKKATPKPAKISLAVVIAEEALKTVFAGNHLVHATNQQFYSYIGTHWIPLAQNMLIRILFGVAKSLIPRYTKIASQIVGLLDPASKALIAMTATDEDVFGFLQDPKPVVNCLNGEVWIARDGSHELQAHRWDHYLLTCLPHRYDPTAVCPIFDAALSGIFSKASEPEEIIRHLWEIFGYIAQPHKNIPAYFIFQGGGSNGKSMIGRILTALVGAENMIPKAVTEFLDSDDKHATTALHGKLLLLDDDADLYKALPEAALKKLAENKQLQANPKFKDAYTFKSTASPLIFINRWPRFKDLSHGMLRKAYPVPFDREFTKEEEDLTLGDRIIESEMSGILNRALDGYRRLRLRGHFDVPKDCQIAFDNWLAEVNPLVSFVNQICIATEENLSFLDDLYEAYRNWCSLGGIRHPVQLSTFEMSLSQLGYLVTTNCSSRTVSGLGLKS